TSLWLVDLDVERPAIHRNHRLLINHTIIGIAHHFAGAINISDSHLARWNGQQFIRLDLVGVQPVDRIQPSDEQRLLIALVKEFVDFESLMAALGSRPGTHINRLAHDLGEAAEDVESWLATWWVRAINQAIQ